MHLLRVAIVDDEQSARTIIRSMLKQEQIPLAVTEVGCAKDALNLAERDLVDVMLLDIAMPEMNGLELLRILHEKFPQVQVIMMTMYRDFSYAVESMRNGAVDYLLKDGSERTRLHECLQRIISQRQTAVEHSNLEEENRLNLQMQRQEWKEQCGRIAVFRAKSVGAGLPLFEQRKQLKDSGLFGQVFPIERNYWLAQTDAADAELLQRLRIPGLVLSPPTKLTLDDPVMYADAIAAERFYIEDRMIVSGAVYRQNAFAIGNAEIRDAFWVYMMEQKAEALDRIAEMAIAERVAPRALKSILYGFVQDWCGVRTDAKGVLEQIERSETWSHVRMVISGFALKERLENESDEHFAIQRLKKYIRSNLGDDLSLDALARRTGYAPTYLSMLFKQQCGIGLKRFIIDARLSGAAEALRETDRRIYEIAKAFGFHDARYFSGLFFKTYHVTPQEYRKKVPHG